MLRKEQNDLLTQTGPGTPMGDMFRCYWIPALLADKNCHVHHYSKTEVREGRKLGHATWAGASPA